MQWAEGESCDDAELLAAAGRGDARGFEVLYGRHRQWMYRLAFRFTGHDADAWDVVQEGMLYLARNAGRIRLSASLRTLMFGVIRHAAMKANAKRRRLVAGEELLAAMPAKAEGDAGAAELMVVLESLDLAHRQVVILRYVDGLTVEEVAEVLSIPAGTVKSRLFHAHRVMRENPRIRRYFGET